MDKFRPLNQTPICVTIVLPTNTQKIRTHCNNMDEFQHLKQAILNQQYSNLFTEDYISDRTLTSFTI